MDNTDKYEQRLAIARARLTDTYGVIDSLGVEIKSLRAEIAKLKIRNSYLQGVSDAVDSLAKGADDE